MCEWAIIPVTPKEAELNGALHGEEWFLGQFFVLSWAGCYGEVVDAAGMVTGDCGQCSH